MASPKIDILRLNGASRENPVEFFDRLGLELVSKVSETNTWNMDEVGAKTGLGDSPLVVGPAALYEVFTMDTPRGEWATSLEAISAAGKVLPPLVIFKGKVVQKWFNRVDDALIEDWHFKTSEKGWTGNSTALKRLNEAFLHLTQPEIPSEWRHLILDGHASHCSEEFMLACFDARVRLNFLPAHTSQVLQPLDLGPFSVLKRAYQRTLRQTCEVSLTMTPKKPEFLQAWSAARKEAFTHRQIAVGWQATGIWPRDPNKVLNSRLARQCEVDRPEGSTWQAPPPKEDLLASQMSALDFQTPRSSRQIHQIQAQLRSVDLKYDSVTMRQVFRKTGKALDIAIAENATLKRERDQLGAALKQQKPPKRRKVQTAQERFTRLVDVRLSEQEPETAGMAGPSGTARSDTEDRAYSEEESDRTIGDCIEIY